MLGRHRSRPPLSRARSVGSNEAATGLDSETLFSDARQSSPQWGKRDSLGGRFDGRSTSPVRHQP